MAKKQKALREPFNLRKEARLLPGYIVLLAWVIFTAVLLAWIVMASFSTTKEIFSNTLLSTGFHIENYVKSWTTGKFSVYFMNSIIYTSFALVTTILISAPAAYVLSRYKFLGGKVIQRLFVMGLSVPPIMLVMPLYGQAVQWGLMDNRFVIMFIYMCVNVPFTTFFLINYFATLSTTFEEAAAIDGCTARQTFFKIMLPLVQPGIITVAIFLFVNVWNEFVIAFIFAKSTGIKPLGVGLFSIIQSMKNTGDWASLFASVMIVVLPTFILYLFISQKIIAGVTGGGVKE